MNAVRLMIIVVVVLVLCGLVWAQSNPPLGDVVKQKPAKKAARVITDEDMPQRPAAPATEGQEQPATSEPAAEKERRDAPPISPAVIQKQLQEVNEAAAAKQRVIDRLQQGLTELGIGDLRKEMYETSIKRAQWQLETMEKERAVLEQMLAEQKGKPQAAAAEEEQKPGDEKPAAKPAEEKPGAPSNPS